MAKRKTAGFSSKAKTRTRPRGAKEDNATTPARNAPAKTTGTKKANAVTTGKEGRRTVEAAKKKAVASVQPEPSARKPPTPRPAKVKETTGKSTEPAGTPRRSKRPTESPTPSTAPQPSVSPSRRIPDTASPVQGTVATQPTLSQMPVPPASPAPAPPAPTPPPSAMKGVVIAGIEIVPRTKPLPKTKLTTKQLREFKELLLAKRRELLGDVSQLSDEALRSNRQEARGDLSNMPSHMADVGSDNWEQELTLGLIATERDLLREIDAALQRIKQGTYGVCLATHRMISIGRLRAKPWAQYCIEVARLRDSGRIPAGLL